MTIAIEQYARQTQSMLALLKTLGASRRQIAQLLDWLGCFAVSRGYHDRLSVGLAHSALDDKERVGNALPADLASSSIQPYLLVFGIGGILIFITD